MSYVDEDGLVWLEATEEKMKDLEKLSPLLQLLSAVENYVIAAEEYAVALGTLDQDKIKSASRRREEAARTYAEKFVKWGGREQEQGHDRGQLLIAEM
jgi:hypothetical protein